MTVFASAAYLITAASLAKEVVHTPWWPPGSEVADESVGIVSRDRVFMTAMMERKLLKNTSFTLHAELSDVSDIAEAAGTNLSNLVACLVNTKPNRSASMRVLVEQALGANGPALTVVEMLGEYSGMFDFQLSCEAVLPSVSRRVITQQGGMARAIVAGGIAHLSVTSSDWKSLLERTGALTRAAAAAPTDDWLSSVVECSVFVRTAEEAAALRSGLSTTAVPPSLLVVAANTSGGAALSLMCSALVASTATSSNAVSSAAGAAAAPSTSWLPEAATPGKTLVALNGSYAVVAQGLVYATLGAVCAPSGQ